MNSREVREMAARFWQLVGTNEPFPRTLEPSVLWALPVAVVKIPRLGLTEVRQWLARRTVHLDLACPDRRMRACLVARSGTGIVFLDGVDPEDERRLSLAHEVAHFLVDYLWPRERAIEILGAGIRGVLDGVRPPTCEERLNAVLARVQLGTFTHLMDRSPGGSISQVRTLDVEDRADRLALELLSPWSEVRRQVEARGATWREPSAYDAIRQVLAEVFGLPSPAAEIYGDMIVRYHRWPQSFREWISQ